MHYIQKLHLPRRTLLRGLGAAVALPFLDAMVPAMAAEGPKPIPRMGFTYFPNGFIKSAWAPKETGEAFNLMPTLQSLAPVKGKTTILSGLSADPSNTVSGFHDRAVASYLTGVERSRDGLHVGISVDQIAAKFVGRETQLASMELAIQEVGTMGSISWKSETSRMPLEINPRLFYERMFGDIDSLDPTAMARKRARQKTVLDSLTESSAALQSKLGAGDKAKLEEYLDSIRDIERRMALSAQPREDAGAMPAIQRPAGIPTNYVEHVRLMMDLTVAALQADMTRVWTFMLAQEASNLTYPEIGVSDAHHPLSHDGGNPDRIAAMMKINRHHADQFGYFVQKLDSIREGDHTLLDQTMAVYGSSLGNANVHMQRDLPTVLVGGGALGIKGGRHIAYPVDKTPIADLHLSLLQKMNIPLDHLGDSTGHLRGLDV